LNILNLANLEIGAGYISGMLFSNSKPREVVVDQCNIEWLSSKKFCKEFRFRLNVHIVLQIKIVAKSGFHQNLYSEMGDQQRISPSTLLAGREGPR